MHGWGVETWSNGLVYEGYFRQGLKQPRGVLRFADGDVYEGDVLDGIREGRGVSRYGSTGDKSDGDWR